MSHDCSKMIEVQVLESLSKWFPKDELHSLKSFYSDPRIQNFLDRLYRKDPYTFQHSFRVAKYSQWLAEHISLSGAERADLYKAALLHDIGKIFTPDLVLKKPGPLTAQEFAIIKQHPIDSAKLCSQVPELNHLLVAIRCHHERYDGRGYPDGLRGEEIPLYARIIFIADTYDAMTSSRVYRKKLDLEKTYQEIIDCSGTQFDPILGPEFVAAHKNRVHDQDSDKLVA